MENTNQNNKGAGKNTGMAVIAYIIFFIPLLTDAKNDPFVKYHVKQGLVLFICGLIASFIPIAIPFLGMLVSPLISLATLALAIIGIMNATNGVEKPLPIIGQFADKFKF